MTAPAPLVRFSIAAQEFVDDCRKGGCVLEAVAPALPVVQAGVWQALHDALRILKRHLGTQSKRYVAGRKRWCGRDKVCSVPVTRCNGKGAHQHIAVSIHDEAGGGGTRQRVPHPPVVVDKLLVGHPLRWRGGVE